eukprot:scaffold2857_cov344-Pavlova_lutheri.AAC.21
MAEAPELGWLPMGTSRCLQRLAGASPDAAIRTLAAFGSGMDARAARSLATRTLESGSGTSSKDTRKVMRALVLFCGPQLDATTRAAVDDALLRGAERMDAEAEDIDALRDAALSRRGSADGSASSVLVRAVKLFERGMRDGKDVAKAIACRSAMVACAARLQPTCVPMAPKRSWRHAEDEKEGAGRLPPMSMTMDAMDKYEEGLRRAETHVQEDGRQVKKSKIEENGHIEKADPSTKVSQDPAETAPTPAMEPSVAVEESRGAVSIQDPVEPAKEDPGVTPVPVENDADPVSMHVHTSTVTLQPRPLEDESEEEDSEGSLPELVGFGELDPSEDAP